VRCQKLNEDDVAKLDLKFKITGDTPYKCVVSAFTKAGFKRTKGKW